MRSPPPLLARSVLLACTTLGLARPALAACEAAPARIQGTIPFDRATEVPTDTRIGLWWTNYAEDPEFLAVQADGEPVSGTVETMVHEESAAQWTGITMFTPDAALPVGARVTVAVTAPDGAGSRSFGFVVGEGPAEEAIAAPGTLSLSVSELPEKADAPCGESRRRFSGKIGVPAHADPLSWLFIHRTTPDGTLDEWFTVVGTAADAPLTWSATSTDFSRGLDTECFTVVQVDPAGGRVASAEAVCATLSGLSAEERAAGGGCTTAAGAAGLWGLWGLWTLPLIGYRRR